MILKPNRESDSVNCSPIEINSKVTLKRKDVRYENLSKRFDCFKRDFKKQFAHIYAGRLKIMKPALLEAVSTKWGKHVPVRKLSDLTDENNENCIVIGTLFKHQELKPSILKEISEENSITPQPVLSNFMSENDLLILEDETQRIRLIGDFNVEKFVTGIVLGILGFQNSEGKFEVKDICFVGVTNNAPEKPISVIEDCYILFVSGLNLRTTENQLAVELLMDWVKGDIGSEQDQTKCAQVCRMVISGNSIGSIKPQNNVTVGAIEIIDELDGLSAVKELDEMLTDLVKTVEVDIMPGELDPSNHIMPQQAFYECLFPKASKYKSFQTVTNPYEFKVENIRILGTSGQPIENIKSFSSFTDGLDILENTLSWGHIAPTAPDTLACYPYYKEDPFIINESPDVYFVGNQPDYKTKFVLQNGKHIRLVTIPSFSKTRTCVLLNLKTLDCIPLTFKV